MKTFPPHRLAGPRRALRRAGIAAAALACALSARAQTADPDGDIGYSLSTFGSVGWSRSDRGDLTLQRFIDRSGTFARDSLLGAQLDLQATPRWSLTLQARLAPADDSDSRWALVPSWAFVAWRPNDDWLLRAGKLRAPLFLRSENLDVGQTYDEARLPSEVYGSAPTNDFTGLAATHTLTLPGGADLMAEGYWGHAATFQRFWLREGLPPGVPAGAEFRHIAANAGGLVVTWRAPGHALRVGLHRVGSYSRSGEHWPTRPTLAPLGGGLSYWQTSNLLPGPGVSTTTRLHNSMVLVGGEATPAPGWRVAGEAFRIFQRDTELGNDSIGGYLTIYRRLGAWTPYATVAQLRSLGEAIDWARRLESTTVPGTVPNADTLNASMRLAADHLLVYRQHSVMLGSAYALTPRSKLKAEWMRTQADISQRLDLPTGEPLFKRRSVDVISLGYHFAF